MISPLGHRLQAPDSLGALGSVSLLFSLCQAVRICLIFLPCSPLLTMFHYFLILWDSLWLKGALICFVSQHWLPGPGGHLAVGPQVVWEEGRLPPSPQRQAALPPWLFLMLPWSRVAWRWVQENRGKIKTGFLHLPKVLFSGFQARSTGLLLALELFRPASSFCPDVCVLRAPLSFPSLTAAVYSEHSASLGDSVRVPPRASRMGAGSARSACLAGALC